MKNLLRAVALGACLAILSLAAACSSADSSRSVGSTSSEETRSFSVDEADVSFELPSDWEEFDRDKMRDALSDSSAMDDLFDRMGVSIEQFQQMMASNVVLFVTAPYAEGGFLDNVNVVVADGRLPSMGAFELQYRGLGATDVHSVKAITDVGDGYATTYTLEVNGTEVNGQAVALGVDDQAVVITVSSRAAGEADELANGIRHSVARTP